MITSSPASIKLFINIAHNTLIVTPSEYPPNSSSPRCHYPEQSQLFRVETPPEYPNRNIRSPPPQIPSSCITHKSPWRLFNPSFIRRATHYYPYLP